MTRKHLPPKLFSLFFIYGTLYMVLEVLWRAVSGYEDDVGMIALSSLFTRPTMIGYTSLWMGVVGGLCGLALGGINEIRWVKERLNIFWQSLAGAVLVLLVELLTGLILNVWMGLGIWDYSEQKFNIMGQICLPSLGLWFFLSPLASWMDDFIRWCLYDEITDLKSLWKTYLECVMFWKKP